MSTIIKMRCIDQVLTFESTPVIASGGLEEDVLQVEFCSKWDGMAKTAVFWRNEPDAYHVLLNDEGAGVIPPEVLAEEGVVYFGVFGVNPDGKQRTSEVVRYTIIKGAITGGTKPSDPTPDVYTQLLAKYDETLVALDPVKGMVKDAAVAAAAAEAAAAEASGRVGAAETAANTAAAAAAAAEVAAVEAVKNAEAAASVSESAAKAAAAAVTSVEEVGRTAGAALPQAGGTMTGLLTLADDPVDPLHAVTKRYVDNRFEDFDPADLSDVVPVEKGGTGAATAAEALTNLGAAPMLKLRATLKGVGWFRVGLINTDGTSSSTTRVVIGALFANVAPSTVVLDITRVHGTVEILQQVGVVNDTGITQVRVCNLDWKTLALDVYVSTTLENPYNFSILPTMGSFTPSSFENVTGSSETVAAIITLTARGYMAGYPNFEEMNAAINALLMRGSYVGTGTSGADNCTTLTVPCKPRMVIIFAGGCGLCALTPTASRYTFGAAVVAYSGPLTFNEETLTFSWYMTERRHGTGSVGECSPVGQINESGQVYEYVIIPE